MAGDGRLQWSVAHVDVAAAVGRLVESAKGTKITVIDDDSKEKQKSESWRRNCECFFLDVVVCAARGTCALLDQCNKTYLLK